MRSPQRWKNADELESWLKLDEALSEILWGIHVS
jgi:hypothetical protein